MAGPPKYHPPVSVPGWAYAAFMRRLTPKIALALSLGLLVTLGVAWGCALRSPVERTYYGVLRDGPFPKSAPQVPPEWLVPLAPGSRIGSSYSEYRGFGIVHWEHMVGEWNDGPPSGLLAEHRLLGRRAGWPLVALEWTGRAETEFSATAPDKIKTRGGLEAPDWLRPEIRVDISPSSPEYLPFIPVPFGLVVDTFVYALLVFLLMFIPVAARRAIRRRSGRCPACGYDRAGLAAKARCPECASIPAHT